jgi:hypothetical protein
MRSGGWKKRLCIDQSEKAFGGAISDRPTVAAFAEGPSAFSRESVITPGSGEFVDHLIFQKVAASIFDHPSGGEFRAEVGHSLESESGVPDFGRGEALAGDVVRVVPEITGELTPTAFDPICLSLHKMGQGVIAGVDRGLSNVVRLFVLVTDMFVGQTEGFFS